MYVMFILSLCTCRIQNILALNGQWIKDLRMCLTHLDD